ncbi:MAG: hypothetical protein F4Y50_11425 [Dehalococcoidia bacterium]|nr:hypothetical protein [Dehalococcoidia bacterium]
MLSRLLLHFLLFGWTAVIGWAEPSDSLVSDTTVVAEVAGQAITADDVARLRKRLLRLGRDPLSPAQALRPLIDRKILFIEAEARGLAADSLVLVQLAAATNQHLVDRLYLEEVSLLISVSEAEIREQYHARGLDRKREVRGRHIAVATEGEAVRMLEQLRNGADFAGLARQSSLDSASAAKGGDMGFWQEEDARRSGFVETLFALDIGEISEPYQDARGGYHLIQATEEQLVGFERQAAGIQRSLERRKKDARWRAYLDTQAEQSGFEIDQSTLDFLIQQGRRAEDLIPTVAPQDGQRVLCRFDGGSIGLAEYVEMLRAAPARRRPAPVDSADIIHFVRTEALITHILPQTARERGWLEDPQMRRTLAQKREELLVDRLRRVGVEEPFLGETLLRSYYDDHEDEFRVEARAVVEGGILSSHQQALAVAARARAGADLFEIMEEYPLFLGEFRKYDVFTIAPGDTTDARDAMVEAADGMVLGEIRGPVAIGFANNRMGFVVLKLLEMRPSHILPFTASKVQQTVRRKIKAERYREIELAFEQYMETLRQKYASQTVIYQHVLDALPTG